MLFEVPGTWELEVPGTWELEVPGTLEPRNLGTSELGIFGTPELEVPGTSELGNFGTHSRVFPKQTCSQRSKLIRTLKVPNVADNGHHKKKRGRLLKLLLFFK